MIDKSQYKIRKDIPIPPIKKGRWRKLPYLELEVGDSFRCDYYIDVNRFHTPAGWEFVCRQVDEDGARYFRVWRCR